MDRFDLEYQHLLQAGDNAQELMAADGYRVLMEVWFMRDWERFTVLIDLIDEDTVQTLLKDNNFGLLRRVVCQDNQDVVDFLVAKCTDETIQCLIDQKEGLSFLKNAVAYHHPILINRLLSFDELFSEAEHYVRDDTPVKHRYGYDPDGPLFRPIILNSLKSASKEQIEEALREFNTRQHRL